MDPDTKELIRKLAMLLDASLEALGREAERERRREAGKALRQITAQQRYETAKRTVAEAESYLGAI